jgi:hypothetical protein
MGNSNLSAAQFQHASNGMYGSPAGEYGNYNQGNLNEQS